MIPPMRWKRGQTGGIEDRRSQAPGGGMGGFGMGGGGGGIPIPIPRASAVAAP